MEPNFASFLCLSHSWRASSPTLWLYRGVSWWKESEIRKSTKRNYFRLLSRLQVLRKNSPHSSVCALCETEHFQLAYRLATLARRRVIAAREWSTFHERQRQRVVHPHGFFQARARRQFLFACPTSFQHTALMVLEAIYHRRTNHHVFHAVCDVSTLSRIMLLLFPDAPTFARPAGGIRIAACLRTRQASTFPTVMRRHSHLQVEDSPCSILDPPALRSAQSRTLPRAYRKL